MSAEHLKEHQFRPGQSGNPAGRPKGSGQLTATLLEKLGEASDDGRTATERIAATLIERATKGDLRAVALIFERVEGRPIPLSEAIAARRKEITDYFQSLLATLDNDELRLFVKLNDEHERRSGHHA